MQFTIKPLTLPINELLTKWNMTTDDTITIKKTRLQIIESTLYEEKLVVFTPQNILFYPLGVLTPRLGTTVPNCLSAYFSKDLE